MDPAKLEAFMGQMVSDMGATLNAGMVAIGDECGLYKAMADGTPVSSSELAAKTDCNERYIREWLNNQAAGGYVIYDPATKKYTLPEEQAFALANENSPVFVGGAFYGLIAALKSTAQIADRFKSGNGFGWDEHDPWLFCGTERLFRPGYRAHLINDWIPALEGMTAKLESGAKVADIGCGHGASTIVMAEEFPNSEFTGFDYHPESVETSRDRAKEAGVANAKFEAAKAKDFAGHGYDLVTMFDCLHDMGDPAGAAAHVLKSLNPDGVFLIVEPFAGDTPEANHNPLGRMFYGASTLICTPCSMSQEVGAALGAQAGEAKIREVVTGAGFTRFRRAAETPFNLVYEARP